MTKRKELISLLDQVTDENRVMFKRMYAGGKLDMEINNVVKGMTISQVKRAIEQVRRTIEINMIPKKIDEEVPVVEETKEEKVRKYVCDRIRDVFYDEKNQSRRDVVGCNIAFECDIEGETYSVEWDGFWDRSDWFSYHIIGGGLDLKGDYFYM